MLLKIDFESDTPIYVQLKNQIIEGMAKGELKPGDSLPSVRQLAEDIGINMHTVNKAYALLKDDGFVSLDRRRGAVVSQAAPGDCEYIDRLREEMNQIISEAYCKQISEEVILDMCSDIYKSFKKIKEE